MRIKVIFAILAPALLPGTAGADNVFDDDEIVVAVIDTGLRPTHQEFDYRGPSSHEDQVVAWWDFTDTAGPIRLPAWGQRWDDRTPDPYDDAGHGTATASLAVGLNREPETVKSPSFAPGAKLAVARVCTARLVNGCPGSIPDAIDWAVNTAGADIVSISIAAMVPIPNQFFDVHEAARAARRAGVLVVVANGNGTANAAGPNPGWAQPYGDSTDVLSVGAADVYGAIVSTDPEVTAAYWRVPVAANTCDTCYTASTGTSFATPLVAGIAAAAMREAVAMGHDAGPDAIETLLKRGARDTTMPPSFEGYGVLDAAQVPGILDHARAGTLPARPDPDVSAVYVEEGTGRLRDVSSNTLDAGLRRFQPTAVPVLTAPQVIGQSVSPGLSEAERYTVTLARGETLNVRVAAQFEFFDLHLYEGVGPSYSGLELVANARYGRPVITYRSPKNATYTVFVSGFSELFTLPYTIEASSTLGAPVTYVDQAYYLSTSTYFG